MFFSTPTLAELESKASDTADALAIAATELQSAEANDTETGSAATLKALQQAREQHDRAKRRDNAAQAKLSAEYTRLATAELEQKRDEFARLVAMVRSPAPAIESECKALCQLDAELDKLIDSFNAKHRQWVDARVKAILLARELGLSDHDLQVASFSTQGNASRALMLSRKQRREESFARGENRRPSHDVGTWLTSAPETVPEMV